MESSPAIPIFVGTEQDKDILIFNQKKDKFLYFICSSPKHGLQYCSVRTQRSMARAAILISILPCFGEVEGRVFMFCTIMEA